MPVLSDSKHEAPSDRPPNTHWICILVFYTTAKTENFLVVYWYHVGVVRRRRRRRRRRQRPKTFGFRTITLV